MIRDVVTERLIGGKEIIDEPKQVYFGAETETETRKQKQFPTVSVSETVSISKRKNEISDKVLQWLRENPLHAELSGAKVSEMLREIGIDVTAQYVNKLRKGAANHDTE